MLSRDRRMFVLYKTPPPPLPVRTPLPLAIKDLCKLRWKGVQRYYRGPTRVWKYVCLIESPKQKKDCRLKKLEHSHGSRQLKLQLILIIHKISQGRVSKAVTIFLKQLPCFILRNWGVAPIPRLRNLVCLFLRPPHPPVYRKNPQ